MKSLLCLKICMLVSLLFHASHVYGTVTNTWTQSSESEFSKGTARQVSLHSTGEIRLSPKVEAIPGIGGAFVWSMAAGLQNQVFVGTGDPGIVYCIKNGSSAEELFRTPELYIQSITTDKQGNLYAGTAPRGIVYKINSRGEASVFCRLPVPYIWGMAVDGDSNLFAATGNEGMLFKITPDGVPTLFFDSSETNLLDVLVDRDNNVYAGTEPNGLIYKLSPTGQARVLYDAGEGEIHCLALDPQGNVYAGTAAGAPSQMPMAPAAQQPQQTAAITPLFKEGASWGLNLPDELPMAQPVSMPQQRPTAKDVGAPAKAAGIPTIPNYVYKITEDGLAQKIFESGQAFILGMSFDAHNNLYVVTGNNPGIYKVREDETSSSLMDVEEAQALCCLNTGDNGLFVGTGNMGKVYKILPVYEKEGVFMSNVFDTATVSDWGRISWEYTLPGGTQVVPASRSGNCERPDHTWSGWSAPYNVPGEKITSPPARFIQYRVCMQTRDTGVTPTLRMVSLSYLPKNQPPKIVSFAVEKEASPASQKPAEAKTNGKAESKPQTAASLKPHHQAAQKNIQWEVEDPNNDTLQLTVYYKGVDEKSWKVADRNTQKKGSHTWDTLRLPDGKYQIKLSVSDNPDNPPEIALQTEDVIQSVVIDNSRPTIKGLSAASGTEGKYVISGATRDDYSNVVKVQYTLDGQEWVSAYPVDGAFDSQDEVFQITTKPLPAGDYGLIVNAFDSEGNVGVEKVLFEAK